MINGVNSNVNNIQYLRATQAFKAAINNKPKTENTIEDTASISINTNKNENIKVSTTEDPILTHKKEYISELKSYLKDYKEINVADKDIKDALKYGDSILIDRTA